MGLPELGLTLLGLLMLLVMLGGGLWLSFAVLTVVAWGTLEASGAAYRQVRKAFGWPAGPGWDPHAGVVAMAGWALAMGCTLLAHRFGRSGALAELVGSLYFVSFIGMFISACGLAMFKRRAAGQARPGEKLTITLTMLAWCPYYFLLFLLRD